MDAGANVDAKASHLVQYAIMGSVYARHVLGKERPVVGLMSVGSEDEKGNPLPNTNVIMASSWAATDGSPHGSFLTHASTPPPPRLRPPISSDATTENAVARLG